MSYDIYLQSKACASCGHVRSYGDLPDPTYNLTPIFDMALTGEALPNPDVAEGAVVLLGAMTDRPRGLRLLSGKQAQETDGLIRRALTRLTDVVNEPSFKALEPSNGWGTLEDAVSVMKRLLVAATEEPLMYWEIH